ncbi:MAG: hypothetical protein AB2551_12580 [Candidatus Thiodiazotropha sp.]
MDIAINIALLMAGFIGAVAAIGGDTWHKGDDPVLQRITKRGWLSIVALSLTLGLGVVKEISAVDASKEAKEAQKALRQQLSDAAISLTNAEKAREKLQADLAKANQGLSASQESLEEANGRLERAQRKLAAIEPDILEGMFSLTERIPREQDFAFANVNGQHRVVPISSETDRQLVLYGGDVFEWHHFCEYPRNLAGVPQNNPLIPAEAIRPKRPFILDTEFRDYEIDSKEGEIRISGPIGEPLEAVIINNSGYENCGFKIVVKSTDRTRTQRQFEPLLRKIREAKRALQ